MNSTQSILNRIVCTLTIACVCFLLTGCTDLQGALSQATSWRDHAQQIQSDLQAQNAELISLRASLPTDSPHAIELDNTIAQAQVKTQLLASAIAQADLIINEATNPTDTLTRATNVISPWIPAPAQGPVVLGAALIATLLRSRNLKENANSIIRSIEHLTRNDQDFEQLFKKHADTIRTIQTPGARKMIDSTVRKSNQWAIAL